VALRWHSGGTPVALRWHSGGTPVALNWHSGGTQFPEESVFFTIKVCDGR